MATNPNTIASYPTATQPLDGTEDIAAWQNGQQVKVTTQAMATFSGQGAVDASVAAVQPLVDEVNTALDSALASNEQTVSLIAPLHMNFSDQRMYTGDSSIAPVLTYYNTLTQAETILLGWDLNAGAPIGALGKSEMGEAILALRNFAGEGPITPLMARVDHSIDLGWHAGQDKFFIRGVDNNPNYAGRTLTDFNHLIGIGQSLMAGQNTQGTGGYETQPFDGLMFVNGERAQPGAGQASLTALVKTEETIYGAACGESPGISACNLFRELAHRRGVDMPIFWSNAAVGGQTIPALASTYYNVFTSQITQAKALAEAAGKTYSFHGFLMAHGEAPTQDLTTPETYAQQLDGYRMQVDGFVRQTAPDCTWVFPIFMTQNARAGEDTGSAYVPNEGIPLLQLEYGTQRDGWIFVTNTYPFQRQTGDSTHLTNLGEETMGAYFARAMDQYFNEGRRPDCILPLSAWYMPNEGTHGTVHIRIRAPKPLQLNTTAPYTQATDYGFAIKDESGLASIGSVTLDNTPRNADAHGAEYEVLLALGAAPSGAFTARYGLDYCSFSGLLQNSNRNNRNGNLCDTTADTYWLPKAAAYVACPHWSPFFELDVLTIPYGAS